MEEFGVLGRRHPAWSIRSFRKRLRRCVRDVPKAVDARATIDSKKRFNALDEGLLVSSSRGDKTAIELFTSGVQGWEAGLRRHFPGNW